MRDYKGWTAQERLASLKKTKAAITAGKIPPPTKCNRCGKESGRIDYHNHDYSDPIKYLEQLCQGCHTRLHRMENKEIDNNRSNDDPKKNSPEKAVFNQEIPKPKVSTTSETWNMTLSEWLEKGMKLPLSDLPEQLSATPIGVKPLKALRGLGIVFCNGFTKEYDCPGYPKTVGIGRDRARFELVLERVRYHEKNGESLKVKGVPLSEKLESNYGHNR